MKTKQFMIVRREWLKNEICYLNHLTDEPLAVSDPGEDELSSLASLKLDGETTVLDHVKLGGSPEFRLVKLSTLKKELNFGQGHEEQDSHPYEGGNSLFMEENVIQVDGVEYERLFNHSDPETGQPLTWRVIFDDDDYDYVEDEVLLKRLDEIWAKEGRHGG